jgi:hypothetical protein
MKQVLLGIFILAFASFAYADVIWDNGDVDEQNGLCCQRGGAVAECDVADDIHTDMDYTITGFVWETVDDATYAWDETDDFVFFLDTGAGPEETPYIEMNVPNTREAMGTLFSRPWWRYTIDLAPEDQFVLEAGDYFVMGRPVATGTSGQSFWLTSPGSAMSESQSYFRSAYFGYNTWVPGENVFGSPYEVNFKLHGMAGGGTSCYFVDPPSVVYTGDRVILEKCYVNDTDQEVTFSGSFNVYIRTKLVESVPHPDVVVPAMSEKCVRYRTPRIPNIAKNKTFEVCNEGTADCCFTVDVLP